MSYLIKPAGYKALLNLSQTEMGIKTVSYTHLTLPTIA